MPKRFTDTEIWKSQRWFRKLSPINKLIFFYIKDQCNHAGIWKIDCSDLIDDLGLESFDIENFINEMNSDFDKINGKKIEKERVKILKNNNLWITGFIQFQYESKEKVVSESSCVKTALLILKGLEIYEESLSKGYITLKKKDVTLDNGLITDKDKDTHNTLINNNKNKDENLKNSNLFRQPIIPTKNQVWEYFHGQRATKDMAKAFYDKYDGTGWFLNGSPIIKWESLANTFITNWNKIEEQRKNKNSYNNEQPKVQTLRKLPNSPTPRYD